MGIKEELANNPEVQVKAQSNNEHEYFKTGIKDIYDDLMIDRLDSPDRDTANKIMGSKDVYDIVLSKIAELIFDEFRTKIST